jgi:hypothetical protein
MTVTVHPDRLELERIGEGDVCEKKRGEGLPASEPEGGVLLV